MISQIKTGSENAEAELLVHCARLEIDPARAERIRSLAGSNLNWTKLVSWAQRHALVPLLFFQLNRVAADLVPNSQLKPITSTSAAGNSLAIEIMAAASLASIKLR
jgi:hypothetical protein